MGTLALQRSFGVITLRLCSIFLAQIKGSGRPRLKPSFFGCTTLFYFLSDLSFSNESAH